MILSNETILLLAMANGRLGDFESDIETLKARRAAVMKLQGDKSPLAARRPTIEQIARAIVDAEKKTATLRRMIDTVERGA